MSIGMVIAAGFVVAGIVGLFLVWRALDRIDRFWEELGGQRPRPRTPKPSYRPPGQKGRRNP